MTKNGIASTVTLIAGVVFCTAARVMGILFFTDMKTGFLFHENELMYCVIFYAILAVSALLSAFLAPKTPQPESMELSKGKTLFLGWIMVLLAAFAAWDGIENMNAVKPLLMIIIGDFAAAVYIEILGITTLVKKKIGAGVGFMYSVVGIYFILRAIAVLSVNMVVLEIQEHLLNALGVTAGGVFFTLFGTVYSGNAQKRTIFFMRLWGAAAAVLTLSSSIGTFAAKFLGSEDISGRITADFSSVQQFYQDNVMSANGSYLMTFVPYVNTLMGIFALVAVIMSFSREND